MVSYEIIETDEGLAVAEIPNGATAEEVALARDGILIDPGPYESYEEAYDAMLALEEEEDQSA